MKTTTRMLSFTIVLALLAACAPAPTPTAVPSATFTPPPTATPIPTATALPTSTPTPMLPKLTSTPIKWLESTPECQLPCWWGMTPGKTTIQEARGIMLTYTGQKGDTPKHKVNHYTYTEYQYGLSLGDTHLLGAQIYLYDKDGLLEGIKIDTEDYRDRDLFWNEVNDFRPVNFLITYGEPSNGQVLIFWDRPSPTTHEVLYKLLFEYSDRGIMVEYGGLTENIDDMYTICPNTNSLEFFQLYLFNPKQSVFIPPFDKHHALTFDESSSISLANYYQQVIRDSTDSCFSSSQSVWDEQ